jgi:hypothetical protein
MTKNAIGGYTNRFNPAVKPLNPTFPISKSWGAKFAK